MYPSRGNLVAGDSRAAGSNHGRFLYLNRPPGGSKQRNAFSRFIDPASGDYRLRPDSACRGVATLPAPALEPPGASTAARPRSADRNIGAY